MLFGIRKIIELSVRFVAAKVSHHSFLSLTLPSRVSLQVKCTVAT